MQLWLKNPTKKLCFIFVLFACARCNGMKQSESITSNLDEEYFKLPLQETEYFDLKQKLEELLIKMSNNFDITIMKDLLKPEKENLDNWTLESSDQLVNNKQLKEFSANQKNSIYEDAIHHCSLQEMQTVFPMCYVKKANNLYISHSDCCISDLHLYASKGIDPTLDPIDIFTTHGTWGQNNPNLELKNFKRLALTMSESHRRPVRVFSIVWNGQDSKNARKKAATLLAKIIKQLNHYYVGFIGFSHGVNFFNLTSTQLPPFTALFSICLARPDLDTICLEQQSKCIPLVIEISSQYDTIMSIAQCWEAFKVWVWGPCCKDELATISLIQSKVNLRIDKARPSHIKTTTIITHIPDLLKEMVNNYHHIEALKNLSLTIIPEARAQEHEVNPMNLTLTESILELPEEIKNYHKKTKDDFKKVYKSDVRTPDAYYYAAYCKIYNFFESITPRRY